MNEQKTAVIADSGCDIPHEIAEQMGIRILPFHVIYPEKDYLDDADIDALMVYRRFPDQIPKTSAPSVEEARALLLSLKKEGYQKVIAVAISSMFSGSWNVMRIAAADVEDLDVFVFDTKNISAGSGIFAYWAARRLQDGWDYEKITAGMHKKLPEAHLLYYMDTLTYLEKGGRIGRVKSIASSVLQLKPIIACDREGEYYVVQKARGEKQARRELINQIVEYSAGHHCWIAVMNGNCPKAAQEVEEELHARIEDKEFLYRKQIAASMAINTGPGLIGVVTFNPDM